MRGKATGRGRGVESTSSFPIGFKCQSRGNRVSVDEQGDVQFWPVGGGPTWVTGWPLLSWWPGYSKHLPLFQTSQLFWQQCQERGLQREGLSVWKGVQCIGYLQRPGGSWVVSQLTSQQRQGQKPQPRCTWPSPVVQAVSLCIPAPGHQSLWDRDLSVNVFLNPPPPK